MSDKDPSLMARCPECDSRIYFEKRPDTGQMIVCPECETSLEVIRSNPIQLDWAEDEGGGRAGGGSGFDLDEFFRDGFAEREEDDYGASDGEEDDDQY